LAVKDLITLKRPDTVGYLVLCIFSDSSKQDLGWRFGLAVKLWSLSTSYSTPGPVNTWMGDCLGAGALKLQVMDFGSKGVGICK